jgi:Protein of unknown function (DUF3016)
MNRIHALIAAATLGLAGLSAAQAAGQLDVSFVKPEEFRDLGRVTADRDRAIKTLTEYLQQLGRQLPDGQTLRLEVTDIDMAGEIHPSASLTDIRIARGGADWPYLALRYALTEGGRTLKSGESRLSDMAYLFSRRGYPATDNQMYYEKRLLRDWFDQTILARP